MPKRPHSVINVNMVSLPAKGTSVKAISRSASKPSASKTKKLADGVSVVVSKKKVKTSSKKKAKPANKLKSAIEDLKDDADSSRPTDVTSAIDEIRNRVKETDAKRLSVENSDKELTGGVEWGVPGGSGTGAGGPLDIYTMYLLEIKDLVQKNWAYSESLAGADSDLQTLLVFEVLPSGEIRDIWFTEKSGNKYLDESAYKAVMKANPFPPHPVELSRTVVEVPLRFSPKGLLD